MAGTGARCPANPRSGYCPANRTAPLLSATPRTSTTSSRSPSSSTASSDTSGSNTTKVSHFWRSAALLYKIPRKKVFDDSKCLFYFRRKINCIHCSGLLISLKILFWFKLSNMYTRKAHNFEWGVLMHTFDTWPSTLIVNSITWNVFSLFKILVFSYILSFVLWLRLCVAD